MQSSALPCVLGGRVAGQIEAELFGGVAAGRLQRPFDAHRHGFLAPERLAVARDEAVLPGRQLRRNARADAITGLMRAGADEEPRAGGHGRTHSGAVACGPRPLRSLAATRHANRTFSPS